MLKEFKDFVMRGNVLDLAVAVVIGGAFMAIIGSLVEDILMPLIGLVMGGIDFAALSFSVGEAVVTYGMFIQAVVDFLVVAFVIFLLIKSIEKTKKEEATAPAEPTTKKCGFCFTEISIKATRCPNCTSEL
ncbi:MAG TPA: large conductance mechanosensitive channel protein MscL [Anaerolineales bacterium]|nr:large conductance mechanosensitive channel protein MscL [Anaerolineales bacterium]